MRQMLSLVLVGMLALLAPSTGVRADQDFHTERLPLTLTAEGAETDPPHPALRSGHVVDIHANGPQIGALERYLINGARANSSYKVVLEVFAGDCDGAELDPVTTPPWRRTDKEMRTEALSSAPQIWSPSRVRSLGFNGPWSTRKG
jgi:hypothetical protein